MHDELSQAIPQAPSNTEPRIVVETSVLRFGRLGTDSAELVRVKASPGRLGQLTGLVGRVIIESVELSKTLHPLMSLQMLKH